MISQNIERCPTCGSAITVEGDVTRYYRPADDPRIADLERQLSEAQDEIKRLKNILRRPHPERLVIRMSHQDNHIEKSITMEEALIEYMFAALRDYEASNPK